MSDETASQNERRDFTGFTASADVPGQDVSRVKKSELDKFLDGIGEAPAWRDRYFLLMLEQVDREKEERWDWRKCLLVAWLSLPKRLRWPENLTAFADFVGARPSTIRKWRQNDPGLDERVATMRVELVDEHVADVLDASVDCAVHDGHHGFGDRKMLLEMAGVYKPTKKAEISGPDGEKLEAGNQVIVYIPSNGRDDG